MSELDKYFEKARNVKPIYEEEDTRKFLAGKLSDGGIATNLYNKIKVYPMLTALITSVATIATIALLSISSSDTIIKHSETPLAVQVGTLEHVSGDELPEVKETKTVSTIAANDVVEKEATEKKKQDGIGTVVNLSDDNTIDVKAVNSLKLTKEELAKLGIELDQKSFRVNAFDKYTYTIYQSNEKTRGYYSKDEDKDAMPTPAMITTSTGFKTLTLFKKGNVEAIVDRVKSVDGEGDQPRNELNKSVQMRDFLQRESDSLNVISLSPISNKKDIKVITEKYEIQDDKKVYDNIENDSTAQKKIYEIKIDGKVFSIPFEELIKDGQLDQNKYKEFIMSISKAIGKDLNVDSQFSGGSSNKIENYKLNINTEIEEKVYTEPMTKLIIEDGESDLEFKLKPGQSVWADEDSLLTNKNTQLYSNMSFDFINYNINELIPIEVSFDGVNTDFIVWYEASEDFLTKLPHSLLEKINPELEAINEQSQNCDNAPIKKDDAVMDVWSGCSGAIKEMRVFPNPANSDSKVEFELEDNRQVSIAVYDLSGKLIKKIKNSDSYSKGRITEALNLNGVNPGLYYVVVKSEIGEQALQRIIIE